MGIRCGFFNSINQDRLYPAEDMNKPYELLVSNGVFATQKGTPSNYLQVLGGNSMTLTVKAGRGIFADKWFVNDSDISIVIEDNNNIVPRIDSVIVRIDNRVDTRAGDIIVLNGTPTSTPVPPAINNIDNVKDYRLANVYVAPSAAVLSQSAITDKRGTAECPWVTSLIQQVDTSTLYLQYETAFSDALQTATEESAQMIADNNLAFNTWFTESQAAAEDQITTNQTTFDTWFDVVKETLASATLVRSYNSVYTTTAANEMIIPIGIAAFNKELDILQVYVNGLRLNPNIDYTVGSNEEITLTKDVYAGTPVSFEVFKSIDGVSDAENLEQLVYELQTQLNTVSSGLTSFQSTKSQPEGLASLDEDGKLTASQIPAHYPNQVWFNDSCGVEYPALYQNELNLWIGSDKGGEGAHHTGKTYISSGYTGSTETVDGQTINPGYRSIYISVPEKKGSAVSHAGYEVWHTGNTSRLLWQGSIQNGTITVPDISNYNLFQISMEGQSTNILATRNGTSLKGIGGYCTDSAETIASYHFNGHINGGTTLNISWCTIFNLKTQSAVQTTVSEIRGLL